MRAIKFRAFYVGKMYDVFAVNPMNHTVYLSHQQVHGTPGDDILVPWNDGIEEDGCALMQFTGLSDKNGVEIYEGDVMECCEWEGDAHAWNPVRKAEVVFEHGCFTLGYGLALHEYQPMPEEPGISVSCEVIGNIYTHPHLLQEGENK